ncbi:MAG: serine protease, partial [Neglectibacter timonensis]
ADIPIDYTYRRIHETRELLSALLSAWGRGKSLLPPRPESFSALVTRKIVSVTSQVVYILRRLWKQQKVSYHSLFEEKRERSERVAAFLAVLELVKSKRIRVEGEGDRSQVILRKGGERH